VNRLGEREKEKPVTGHIELQPSDHEEPTWEVRHPNEPRRRRLDGRTRAILSIAAVAAIVVNAGAAWAYWRITGSETSQAAAGASIELALRARSDLNIPLRPGETGGLAVSVTNNNDFPIRITTVTPGAGNVVADDEHRDAGCKNPGVRLNRERFSVSWDVQRNTVGAFQLPGALSMRAGAARSCDGAVFSVPIEASGFAS
jgi:hypothetical protein